MADVRVERIVDVSECDDCGFSCADGARILIDGSLHSVLEPRADCFGGVTYDDDDIYREIHNGLYRNVAYSTEQDYFRRVLESRGHSIEFIAAKR